MGEWRHQIRVYLTDALADLARRNPAAAELRPLTDVLARHDATMVSQFDAFMGYVTQAEQEGVERFPLYKWTRATVDDPEKRAAHIRAFALRVGGEEVYETAAADALEADVGPLEGGGIVTRMSRHDTNPAGNIPVPQEYR